MVNLYPDQQRVVDDARAAMARYKRVLIQSPTGSGKSVMASYMVAGAVSKGNICAFIVPRRQLVEQMSDTFNDFNILHSFVAAGKPFNPYSRAYICSSGTLVNRLECISPRVVFIDESHYGAAALDRIIRYYANTGAWVIGLSATPEKPNGQGLDRWYEYMVQGQSVAELIALRRLSDYRLFSPSKLDLSGVSISAGDYNKKELAGYMEEQRVLIGDMVTHYRRHAMGKLNVTFCTSVKHSQMICESFNNAGIPSAHVDADTPDEDRRRIARAFAQRELLNICSVDLMTFGYDLSSASGIKGVTIESMSDGRPTKSLPLQMQKWGRVLRMKSEPALIFDHACNHLEFGLPDDDRDWSLQGKKRRKRKKGEEEATIKLRDCPMCFHTHRPAPVCPVCRYVYEVKGREVSVESGELAEISKEEQRRIARREQGQAKSYDDLVALAVTRGYKNPHGWARHVYNARNR